MRSQGRTPAPVQFSDAFPKVGSPATWTPGRTRNTSAGQVSRPL
jgi:hypothetical protein